MLQFESHSGHSHNLVLRPTQPPTLRRWEMSSSLLCCHSVVEGLMWLSRVVVFLHDALHIQLFTVNGCIMCCCMMLISCHFLDCKVLLDTSLTHVSSAIANTGRLHLLLLIVELWSVYSCLSNELLLCGLCLCSAKHLSGSQCCCCCCCDLQLIWWTKDVIIPRAAA